MPRPRADLWAYAAKVAVEYTTEQNNFQCGDSPGDWVEGGGSEIIGAEDCMRNKGEADCEVGGGYLQQGGFDGKGQATASPKLTAIMSGGVGISGRELYKYR